MNRGIHMRYITGYKVWVTEAESSHRGRIAIVWHKEAGWKVKGDTNYGPNVVSFIIAVGWKHW